MNTLWHSVILIGIFYVSWSAFGQTRPLLVEHKKMKLHYVSAGVCCCLCQLIFMFILYVSDVPLGVVPVVCFLTWTTTLLIILRNADFSVFARRLCRSFIIAAPLIFVLYPGGNGAILNAIDSFSVNVFRVGQTIDAKETSQSTSPDVGSISQNDSTKRREFRIRTWLKRFSFLSKHLW